MRPRLRKIVCPKKHTRFNRRTGSQESFDKILAIYHEEENDRPKKFWFHCGDKSCNTWVQVKFNSRGGVVIKPMDGKPRFFADKASALIVEEAKHGD